MHIRVVRFTDVTPQRVEQIVAAINEADGLPPGIPTTGLQLLFDEAGNWPGPIKPNVEGATR